VEFAFGNLRISILVQSRPDVERREYASDDEVHGPDGELLAGTDPRDYEYDYSALAGGTRTSKFGVPYLLPDPNTLSSGLKIRGLIFPSLRNLSGLKASGLG